MKTWLAGLAGRSRLLASAMAGIAATLAMPPLGATPALAAGLVALAWLLDGTARFRSAFLTAFAFAFGFFSGGLYWVAGSFFVVGGATAVAGPAVVLGLAAALSCFLALPAALAHRLTRPGIARALALAAALGLGDWLRGHALTGFPWNLFGHAWLHAPAIEQTAAAVGSYGLGLATLAICLLLSVFDWRAWTAAVLASAAMLAYGELRLVRAPSMELAASGPLLRLVQPNIPQSEKWRREETAAHLQRLVRLGAAAPEPDAVIWPETAVVRLLHSDSPLVEALGLSVESRQGLISGAPWREDGHYYNSILAIDRQGRLQGRHDKAHLVPFGEYVPLRGLLGAAKLTMGGKDFTAGPGPSTLTLPGMPPFGALICFEAIFPGAVTAAGERPAWLLNLTNDAWFGETAGPHQHFEIARMRAIETGLPVVRVANTGITGAVDGYGRRLGRLDLGRTGSLDVRLPPPLAETPFSRLGDLPFFAGVILLAGFAGWCGRRRARS